MASIDFGDTVRVVESVVTDSAGIAGRTGSVYGVTTPSVTGVDVVGGTTGDVAFNVFFQESREDHWIHPDLLEFIDHGAGSEIRIGGAPTKSVRQADGSWREVPLPQSGPYLLRLLRKLLRRRGPAA